MRELMTQHFARITGVPSARPALHHDATRFGKRDRCPPLGRARSDPFAKTLSVGSQGDEHTLRRSREPRKRVGLHGTVEQRPRKCALARIKDGSETPTIEP